MKTMDLGALHGKSDDCEVDEAMQGKYLSVLGGVAWCVLTRFDICIYVVSLQRMARSPKVIHFKRMNRLIN